jgi:inorganic triphosphatase YgiF
MVGELEREIEIKFDIPWNYNEVEFMFNVANIIAATGWNLTGANVESSLQFQYYDTSQLDVYQAGDTIRRVSGFPESSNPEAIYRYDFKVGPIDDRYEVNLWSNELLSNEDISQGIREHCNYDQIMPSAFANTRHLKLFFSLTGTYIEVTHDIFSVTEGSNFKELEIELKSGDPRELCKIAGLVRDETGLLSIDKQKYDRAIEGISGYAKKLSGF